MSMRMMSRGLRKNIGGFTLIELAFSLVIIGTMAAWATEAQLRAFADAESKALGVQMAQFQSAVTAFVFDIARSGGGFAGLPEAGSGWLKDGSECMGLGPGLGTQSFLPCDFPDTLRFGLEMNTTFVPAAPGQGTVAVTTFGPGILQFRGEDNLILAAQAVSHARTLISAGVGEVALETFISFERTAADLITGTVTRVSGVAAAVPFLYTDGANSPVAAINWNNQNLTDVARFEAAEIASGRVFDTVKNRTLSQAIQDVAMHQHNDFVGKPDCPVGEIGEIFISPSSFSAGAVGKNIQGVQAWAKDIPASGTGPSALPEQWQVKLRLITTDGYKTPDTGYGWMTVFTKCS